VWVCASFTGDDPSCTTGLARAHDCTHVAGILDPMKQKDELWSTLYRGVKRRARKGRNCHDARWFTDGAHRVQHGCGHLDEAPPLGDNVICEGMECRIAGIRTNGGDLNVNTRRDGFPHEMCAIEEDLIRMARSAARQFAEAPHQRIVPAGNALHLW
jgi:hypothetical protein